MDFTFWINPDSKLEQYLLPGLEDSGIKSLWILPTSKFSAGILRDTFSCIVGLRCALWKFGMRPKRLPEERDLFHAFADHPSLVNGFLVRTEITYSELVKSLVFFNSTNLYSDVAWLAENQWELLSAFVSKTTFGTYSSLAFLPEDNAKAQLWGNIIVGYLWLVLNSKYKSTRENPLINEDELLLSILKLSVRMGAIPTMVCTDCDMKSALILWGSTEQLEEIGERLSRFGLRGDAETFRKWSSRGVAFVT